MFYNAGMSAYTSQTIVDADMRCCTEFEKPTHPKMYTDVASDLGGMGEYPSPGELLAATVASCMLSMIAFTGHKKGFSTQGISIQAVCDEGKQGVGGLRFSITVPHPVAAQERAMIQAAVASCPVGNSIHPDIPKIIEWNWAE